MLNISFINKELSNNHSTVVFIDEQLKLGNDLLLLDQHHHGLISKTIGCRLPMMLLMNTGYKVATFPKKVLWLLKN